MKQRRTYGGCSIAEWSMYVVYMVLALLAYGAGNSFAAALVVLLLVSLLTDIQSENLARLQDTVIELQQARIAQLERDAAAGERKTGAGTRAITVMNGPVHLSGERE